MSNALERESNSNENKIIVNQEKLNLPQSISSNPLHPIPEFQSNQQGIYDQINNYFSEQDQQQKVVQEARDILGESASAITDVQVYDLVNEMQYLIDTWLEEYEQKIFDGKKLKDLLQSDL